MREEEGKDAWASTWEELLRGDALGERGFRQGPPRQPQLLPLHAVHSLEVAPCRLPILHTQFTAVTHGISGAIAACGQRCNVAIHFCTKQTVSKACDQQPDSAGVAACLISTAHMLHCSTAVSVKEAQRMH